ncbi:hypothetical protein D3C80_1767830 [compost metagenome]
MQQLGTRLDLDFFIPVYLLRLRLITLAQPGPAAFIEQHKRLRQATAVARHQLRQLLMGLLARQRSEAPGGILAAKHTAFPGPPNAAIHQVFQPK